MSGFSMSCKSAVAAGKHLPVQVWGVAAVPHAWGELAACSPTTMARLKRDMA